MPTPQTPSPDAGGSPAAQSLVLRGGRSRGIAWIALAAAAIAAVLTLVQVPLGAAVALLGLPAFIACLCWTCYLRPLVAVDADELRIVNIARTTVIPFSRIAEFDLRLGLTVETKDGEKVGAWALPSTGRRTTRERMGMIRLERHTPEEIQTVLDAYARWEQDADSPVRGAARDVVTRVRTPLPPVLLLLTLAWAVWGLRVAATL
ncbi:hypothetical protein [Brevibacterium album]|uniref:hypothetical protein n=1 Tax=Brevibacterium album TaxID=417948 RepID=UPI00041537B6|nr:hypothetical protein [Brevibacterium album]